MTHLRSETLFPSTEEDKRKAAELRKWKLAMLALLVCAAIIFLGCSFWQHQPAGAPAWVGFVRAAAEAGMIGGLADWFAVTALFRHPLGLKIPHTALIPNNKDKVGDSLGTFVEENFLTKENLANRVNEQQLPTKAAEFVLHKNGDQWFSREAGKLLSTAVENISATEAEELIRTQVLDRMREPQWGPPLGRILESYIAQGKARPLEDDLVRWAHTKIGTLEPQVIELVENKMPGWLPRIARGMAGDKVYAAILDWSDDVLSNPNHDVRLALRRGLSKFAQDLQFDPKMMAKVENLKLEFFDSAHMDNLPAKAWETISSTIIEQANTPDSYLRLKLAAIATAQAHRIMEDPQFKAKLNGYIEAATDFVVDNYASQVIALIPETIKKWKVEEASAAIELQVGKDLQFIRLNGTVVGALAGLAIYTVYQLIF